MAEAGRLPVRRHPDAAALVATLRRHAGETIDLTAPDSGQSHLVSSRIATTAIGLLGEENLDTDEMLTLLIRDALYSRFHRRLLTGMLIAATPYRVPIAEAVFQGLASSLADRGGYPLTSLRLLTNLNVDLHRPLVHDILTGLTFSSHIRHHATWAMPHCAGRDSEETWLRTLNAAVTTWLREPSKTNSAILQGITYGIGTDGHHRLLTRIRRDHQLPDSARTTAQWLEQVRRPGGQAAGGHAQATFARPG